MSEKIIPSFRAEFSDSEISEVLTATEKILRSGRLILGPFTQDFEAMMATIAQTRFAVAVNSGSTALEVIYKVLNVKGRKVLIPTNTNFATAAAAVYAGADVEFYDNGVYPDVNNLMERLTEDVAAVVVVHIGGYITPAMMRIVKRCQELNVPLVEDGAHAHGAFLDGKAAGSFGIAAAFSFFPTKTLTTGEGGVIATSDEAFAALARQYRDQGKKSDGVTHEVWGNSWRMTEMGAALGLSQAKHIDSDNARRAEIISRYERELADTALEFPEQSENSQPAGYKCIAILPKGIDREKLKATLLAHGVQLGKEVYEKPLHHQPIFKQFANESTYPIADDFAARHICLPLWRFMKDEDVTTVIEQLRAELS